ncbi:MAG TPA: VCBS repeat-containing protein, partial [Saprospiraceae bacterium]|nr:VCBS repeat-containing protein [Saprospiraceae bacterium]
QLNNGNGTFSEIAQLAGVSHTDWSWATFFIDADHDGWRDLFVANGQMKDVRNKDFEINRSRMLASRDTTADLHAILFEIAQMAPTKKIKNYFYRNNRDLTFTNVTDAWGFSDETWTQGAAYGDLDNDGDLDVIIHNTNDPVMIYASQINDLKINNYLTVLVEGPGKNTKGINAKVTVSCEDLTQVGEITPVRGYMSSVQPMAHFGLGSCEMVEEVTVEWPDGYALTMHNVPANQTVVVRHTDAQKKVKSPDPVVTVFEEITNPEPISYPENAYDDYVREVLLPYKLSTLGPVAAKADVNGDALDDLYLGGSAGNPGTLYLQREDGAFIKFHTRSFIQDAVYEDGCATFFDTDQDRDLDLYVCSGGNEFDLNTDLYQDRLYLNDGAGNYTRSDALPQIGASTSVAVPMDFNEDGDMDLFVGARQIPGRYGQIPRSLLLRNVNGRYEDIGAAALPDEGLLGMVTDAVWLQAPGAQSQLVIAGEWMRIRMFQWVEGKFEEYSMPGLERSEGMWNRIIAVDIDVDGDLDLIAGNCGKNLKYSAESDKPFKMLVNDFDGNGSNDVYLGYYDKQDGQCYPVRGRECSSQQMPFVKAKFASYSDFAQATINEILEGRMEGSQELNARTFASGIFENVDGEFHFRPFRSEAQIAPVFGIVLHDFNADHKPDIFLAGNYYNREVETTRSDAGIGNLLLSKEGLDFDYVHPSKSGVIASKDVRNVLLLKRKSDFVLAVANNNSDMQLYRVVVNEGNNSIQ